MKKYLINLFDMHTEACIMSFTLLACVFMVVFFLAVGNVADTLLRYLLK